MTQPVQEPTQGRVDQGQEYRTRQLFRRPASGGAAGSGVVPTAMIRLSSTTLGGLLTPTPLTFFKFATTDATVFDLDDDGGGNFGVRLLVDGVYTVQVGFIGTNATASDVLQGYYSLGGGLAFGFFGAGSDREVYPSRGFTNQAGWGWTEAYDVNTLTVPSPTDPQIFTGENRTSATGKMSAAAFYTYFGPGTIDS